MREKRQLRDGMPALSGMLHGRLVHASKAQTRIKEIDVRYAKRWGAAILVGQDLLDLQPYHGPVVLDRPLIAIDRVRYQGEPVAVIAAESPELASAIVDSTNCSFSPLTKAAAGTGPDGEALVHLTDLLLHSPGSERFSFARHAGNQLMIVTRTYGNIVDKAGPTLRFLAFDFPLADSSKTLQATADWNNRTLKVWTLSPDPEGVRGELASIFELSKTLIDVVSIPSDEPPVLPGSIGVEAIAAALARRSRRPVNVTASYRDLGWTGPRGALRLGERCAHLQIDAGAFAGNLPRLAEPIAETIADAAKITSGTVTVEVVYSFAPPIAATLEDWAAAIRAAVASADSAP